MSAGKYTIRQLQLSDLAVYKAMRLEALATEPGFFGNSYGTEAVYTNDIWEERLTNPLKACFGLYYNDELIGITAVLATPEAPTVGYMTQSYIRKAHRGKGLSAMLYDARIAWAKAQGIKTLTIGHRLSNVTSKKANQHYGFVYTHSESRIWPDGATEDMVNYALKL